VPQNLKELGTGSTNIRVKPAMRDDHAAAWNLKTMTEIQGTPDEQPECCQTVGFVLSNAV
jgi:hypothetical protein